MGKAIVSGAGRASLDLQAGNLSIGATVRLMENGVATDFVVVQQGLPGSMYDSSCDGTWLLRKDVYDYNIAWDSDGTILYNYSTLNNWLNNTYTTLLGAIEQATVKEVKLPYVSGSNVVSGVNGVVAKTFPPSASEVGWTSAIDSTILGDGARLEYFLDGNGTDAKNKRVAYLSGTAVNYWTRSPKGPSANAWMVRSTGENVGLGVTSTGGRVRPALIIPSTSRFDRNTLLLKG